jgi:hypothetical protein
MLKILRLTPLLLITLVLVGCAAKPVPVSGMVTLGGTPVEGATVVFVTADGTNAANGYTDSAGMFSLSTGALVGAYPGDYKVIVIKGPKVAGPDAMPIDSAEYMKQMKKEAAESAKASTSTTDAMKMKAMGKGGGMPVPGGGQTVKSELPSIYASVTTTPLTAKVPVENQPIKLELKK